MAKPKPIEQVSRAVQLSDLREGFAKLVARDSNDGFIPIRPGKQIKIYGRFRRRWVYRAQVLRVYGPMRPAKEVIKKQTKQTLDELLNLFDLTVEQLVIRAHTGNERAAEILVGRTIKSIKSLDAMAKSKSPAVLRCAQLARYWPVVLSSNPKDSEWAKDHLVSLNLGAQSIIPTIKGHRVDPRSFWTALVEEAINVCWFNKRFVPTLIGLAQGAETKRNEVKFFGTTVAATFYFLPNDELVIISDWQLECMKLVAPVTHQNFGVWWNVIHGCIWEYWRAYPDKYAEALAKIGNRSERESRRRNLAVAELKQAFKSLYGLRSKRV